MKPREVIRAKFSESLRALGELTMQRDAIDKQIAVVRSDIEALDKAASLFPEAKQVGTLDPSTE